MEHLINIFKNFSDETRLRIILLLAQEKLCVCQLSGILGISQPNISKHLAKLRDTGFVRDERQEKYVYYTIRTSDAVFMSLLEDILKRIGEYPQLLQDQNRLTEKTVFLNQCIPVPDGNMNKE